MKLDRENINDLLNAVNEIGRDDKLKITSEHIENDSFYIYIESAHKEDDDDYVDMDIYRKLIGLEISYKAVKNQYHKSDSTEVTYKVKIKLPNGKAVKFDTEMCYMVGWNYCGDDIALD